MAVAAKKMSYTTDAERPTVERTLRREFRALKQANGHPNIVQLRGIVLDANMCLILLMELSSMDLRARLDARSPLLEPAQRSILKGIAEGMAFLHAQLPTPILHHDLKSQNVLLFPGAGSEHVAKITDFGMATGAERSTISVMSTRMAPTAMGAGTYTHKAPECYHDQFFKASDVYAYAIIGYELLTRKKPWEGKSDLAVMNAVNQVGRPGPLPDTPLGEMVKECWAQEHSERPSFVQLIISPALMPPAATSAAPPHPPSESHLAQEIVAAVRYELEAGMKRNERIVQTNQQMLTALLDNEHECPRVPFLKPEALSFLQLVNPKTWTTNQFRLYFVCPVSKKVVGGEGDEGYPISLPKGWVVAYGPAIKIGLQVISLSLFAGTVLGLPLGPVGQGINAALQAERAAVARLESMLGDNLKDMVHERVAEATIGSVNNVFNALDATEADPIPGQDISDVEETQRATGAAYRALRALIEQKDPTLQHCSLEKVVANDGAVEWVHPSVKERFKRDGREAYFWRTPSPPPSPLTSPTRTLSQKVDAIKAALGLETIPLMPTAIAKANETMGITPPQSQPLPAQADALLEALGV